MPLRSPLSVLPVCLKPWTSFEVDDAPDIGRVRPCCWAVRHVGDIREQGIAEIWNGGGFREFRRRMLEGNVAGFCDPECPNLSRLSSERQNYLSDLLKAPTWNSLRNLFEVLRGRDHLTSAPLHLKVTPSLACNFACVMCYQPHDARIKLPEPFYDEVEPFLVTASTIHVQGGEVFASVEGIRFLRRIARIRVPHLRTGIVTNGTFPHPESWDVLENLRLGWVIVSLDAACRDTFEKIRGQGCWDDVIKNIGRLVRLRGQRKGEFDIYIDMTVMVGNFEEVPLFVELAQTLGTSALFHPVTTAFGDHQFDVVSSPQHRDALRRRIDEGISAANAYGLAASARALEQLRELLSRRPLGDPESPRLL